MSAILYILAIIALKTDTACAESIMQTLSSKMGFQVRIPHLIMAFFAFVFLGAVGFHFLFINRNKPFQVPLDDEP